MSQFAVEVVRIGKSEKNPNADTLLVTEVAGCPVQYKAGDFKEGDLAAYIPVEAMVPVIRPEFAFLKSESHPNRTHHRVKAVKLRKVFSMGFLVPAPAGAKEGDDLSKELGVYKYEEPEDNTTVVQLHDPPTGLKRLYLRAKKWVLGLLGISTSGPKQIMPVYDLESVRKYQGAIEVGEEVVLTEKIHGTNARFGWYKGKFYIGSRTQYRSEGDESQKNYWTRIARLLNLKEKLRPYPGIAIYGEIYGAGVQDLEYGAGNGQILFRLFDVLDIATRRFWSYTEMRDFARKLGLDCAPVLYAGRWQGLEAHAPLGEGKSTLPGADCIREGWVVRPVIERHDPRYGRICFKYVGQGYLLRKGGTERH